MTTSLYQRLLGVLVTTGLSTPVAAEVVFPQFDVVHRSGDAGVSFTAGTGIFTLDATAIALVLAPGDTVDITDVDFFLTALFSTSGDQDSDFRSGGSGSFRVGAPGAPLLTGTFTNLELEDLQFLGSPVSPFTLFQASLVYTGGAYAGSLPGGRIEGQYQTLGDPSLLATHSGQIGSAKIGPVIPVPAAVWLLGSALAGGVAVVRRRRAA